MKTFIQSLAFLLFLMINGWLYAQQDHANAKEDPGQQKRLEMMRSKGTDASLTILPARLMGQNWDRLSEVIGALLEQKGLKNIEVSSIAFSRVSKPALNDLIDSLKNFISAHPITTDYVLYVEMNGDQNPPPIDEVIGIILDRSAALVWNDIMNSEDDAFTRVSDPDPMGYSVLLTERMAPDFGLNAETARNAKPGKMAAKMRERSGLPPEEEMAQMPEREQKFKADFKQSNLVIFPVRDLGKENGPEAEKLAALINSAGMSKARISNTFLLLNSSDDPNEMKRLWDMAKDFRSYIKANKQDADYYLYADYVYTPDNWPAGLVHFIICDRQGDWVIVDFQNSEKPDYIQIKPTSAETCNKLVVARINKYLKTSVAGIIRKTIESSGTEEAFSRFRELRANSKDYLVSEDEMNMLGYEYLQSGKIDEAITVFKLNTEAFPDSFNVYDSLGEAYAAKGEKEAAIKNYEKSVQINPDNTNGIEMLKKLKGGI